MLLEGYCAVLCYVLAIVLTPLQRNPRADEVANAGEQPPSLVSRKQQFVRSAIWDAGINLFAEKGFDETTVEEIAQAAGVSRRSFFRYFSSKSDLMGENMVMYAKSLTEAIAACPATYSLLDVIRQTLLHVATGAAAQPRARTIMQVATHSPAAREAQLSRLAEVQDQVAEAFARRRRRRSKYDLTSRVLAGVTMSLFDVTFRSWFEHNYADISAPAEQALATLYILCGEESSIGQQTRSELVGKSDKRKLKKR